VTRATAALDLDLSGGRIGAADLLLTKGRAGNRALCP
jgi:hypothetical protein